MSISLESDLQERIGWTFYEFKGKLLRELEDLFELELVHVKLDFTAIIDKTTYHFDANWRDGIDKEGLKEKTVTWITESLKNNCPCDYKEQVALKLHLFLKDKSNQFIWFNIKSSEGCGINFSSDISKSSSFNKFIEYYERCRTPAKLI